MLIKIKEQLSMSIVIYKITTMLKIQRILKGEPLNESSHMEFGYMQPGKFTVIYQKYIIICIFIGII